MEHRTVIKISIHRKREIPNPGVERRHPSLQYKIIFSKCLGSPKTKMRCLSFGERSDHEKGDNSTVPKSNQNQILGLAVRRVHLR